MHFQVASLQIACKEVHPVRQDKQGKRFSSSPVFRQGQESVQPPCQSIPQHFCQGMKWPGIESTTHLHVMQRVRMRGAVPLLTPSPSWSGALSSMGTILPLCLNG